jgi:hypothetical protein
MLFSGVVLLVIDLTRLDKLHCKVIINVKSVSGDADA